MDMGDTVSDDAWSKCVDLVLPGAGSSKMFAQFKTPARDEDAVLPGDGSWLEDTASALRVLLDAERATPVVLHLAGHGSPVDVVPALGLSSDVDHPSDLTSWLSLKAPQLAKLVWLSAHGVAERDRRKVARCFLPPADPSNQLAGIAPLPFREGERGEPAGSSVPSLEPPGERWTTLSPLPTVLWIREQLGYVRTAAGALLLDSLGLSEELAPPETSPGIRPRVRAITRLAQRVAGILVGLGRAEARHWDRLLRDFLLSPVHPAGGRASVLTLPHGLAPGRAPMTGARTATAPPALAA
jgi:hypothetical protein